MDDFLIRATVAGLIVAVAAGLLGCFVVWRRMAYFGDATAHAAILGVALAFSFSVSVFLGVMLVTVTMAVAVATMSGRQLAMDTLLGVAAHGALACGLVAVALTGAATLDLEAYLFGDLLAVRASDIVVIAAGATVVVGVLWWRWNALVTATLSPDLAYASGVDPARERLVLSLLLALVVAVALKVVGALLVTAMLVIPAAAARPLARTPESMAAMACLVGFAAVIGGLGLSLGADTPTGPSIVCVAVAVFVATSLAAARRHSSVSGAKSR